MRKFYLKYKEQILYLVFGVIVTLVNWIVYALLVAVIDIGITISNAIAWVAAVITAYITNRLFVFDSDAKGKMSIFKEAVAFLLARISTGIFEVVAPSIFVLIGLDGMLFNIDGFYAKFIVSIIVVILNYVISKKLVFKKQKP